MSTEIYPFVEPEPRPSLPLEDPIRLQYNRVMYINRLAGQVGLANAAKTIYVRIVHGRERIQETDIQIHSLRHPFNLTTADLGVYDEVIGHEFYKVPSELEDRVNGKPVVDLGANIGLTAAYFASRFPDSPVLAIEPHPRNYALLEANAQPYGGRIEPIRAAVAAKPGIVGLEAMEPGEPPGHESYRFSGLSDLQTGELSALAITPEAIASRLGASIPIGILKVDIEGVEKEIFESPGASHLLDRTELLMIETHEKYVPGSQMAVHAAALSSGLKLNSSGGHTTIYSRN